MAGSASSAESRAQSHFHVSHPQNAAHGWPPAPPDLPPGRVPRVVPFAPVRPARAVTLGSDPRGDFRPPHFAFLSSAAEFDAALARIRAGGVKHYATPRRERPGEINHRYGGRGVYFDDPNGHLLEIITRPYGSGGTTASRPHPLFATLNP